MGAKEFWSEVRRIERTLPPAVYLTSLDVPHLSGGGKAGVVIHAERSLAARYLNDGTHRIATDEEITRHERAEQRKRRASLARENLRLSFDLGKKAA